ncbi:hypothetical protein D3C87_1861630 [compost metagenome]
MSPLLGLEPTVAKDQGLRESQRCFSEVKEVEIGAVLTLQSFHFERCRSCVGTQVLADRRRFRHASSAVNEQRNRSERIDVEIGTTHDPGRKREHLQFVRQPKFLKGP